jgi:hypothetical protein
VREEEGEGEAVSEAIFLYFNFAAFNHFLFVITHE